MADQGSLDCSTKATGSVIVARRATVTRTDTPSAARISCGATEMTRTHVEPGVGRRRRRRYWPGVSVRDSRPAGGCVGGDTRETSTRGRGTEAHRGSRGRCRVGSRTPVPGTDRSHTLNGCARVQRAEHDRQCPTRSAALSCGSELCQGGWRGRKRINAQRIKPRSKATRTAAARSFTPSLG